MPTVGPTTLRWLLASVLLLPLSATAFEITYDGVFFTSGQKPEPVTHNAIPVTRHVSVVTTISPVTDATGSDGSRHCWYMIDRERGFKAMIAGRPIETVGPDPFGAMNAPPSAEKMYAIAEFVQTVYQEAEKSGGIEVLSGNCGNVTS